MVERIHGSDRNIITETGKGSEPTTLHLFTYQGAELEQAKIHLDSGIRLKKELAAANGSFTKLNAEAAARGQRIRTTHTEFLEIAIDQRSRRAASLAYLRMVDELSAQGVPPEDIMDFYIKCLKINTRVSTFARELRNKIGLNGYYVDMLTADGGKIFDAANTAIDRGMGEPPAWFNENRQEWKIFVTMHGLFSMYLYPQIAAQNRFIKPDEEEQYPSQTFDQALPDWFTERNGIPDREAVEEELEEDTRESARLTIQLSKMIDSYHYLEKTLNDKWLKAMPRFEDRRRRLLFSADSFAKAIVYLGSTESMTEYALDPAAVPAMTFNQVHATIISAEKSHIRALNRFTEQDRIVLDKEAVALWLEAQLEGGGIITSAQNTLTRESVGLFDVILDPTDQAEAGIEQLLANLKVSNKKVFRALNYEILPLLTLVSTNDKAYLAELIHEYRGGAIEPVIWELAEILSSKLKESDHSYLSRQASQSVTRIKEFSIHWIKNHWRWAFAQLEKATSVNPGEEPVLITQPTPGVELKIFGTPAVEVNSGNLEDIETLITEVQGGNLGGWHLYYTFNRRIDEASLVEIDGVTEEEREANFRQFVTGNSISCSIKPESVIRALEWLVAVPKDVENIRKRKEIKGETFKKLKRGPIRILYKMDTEGKNIVFFIHQKKALGYGF